MKKSLNLVLFSFLLAGLFSSCQKDPAEIINNYLKPPTADAGNPRTVALPVSFDTLYGKTTSYNGKIQGYLWSLISGPNVPVIESPSSINTRVSNMVAGVYRFQFAATDSAGLTGMDTTSITVLPGVIKTLTQQPTNNVGELNFAAINNVDVSSKDVDLDAGAWTSGGNPFYIRGAFKFDLSTIPANATIISAKLSLYSIPNPINGDLVNANTGTNNAFYIQRCTTNWTNTSTWATQPSIETASQILIPHTSSAFLDVTDVDVKNMVSTMVAGNNYGFKIALQSESIYTIRQFCSSRYSDASKHPKLVVTYQ
jgi:hypothetical protein